MKPLPWRLPLAVAQDVVAVSVFLLALVVDSPEMERWAFWLAGRPVPSWGYRR